jgi:hypothetical protein
VGNLTPLSDGGKVKYRIEQQATKWYGVVVEANNQTEAMNKAVEMLDSGKGVENNDSLEFTDEYYIQDENGNWKHWNLTELEES